MLKLSGYNTNNAIYEQSNNRIPNQSFISPPINSQIEISTILSYSINQHTIMINKNGEILFIGNNNLKIIKSLPNMVLKSFTKFQIKSNDGRIWNPVSGCCTVNFVLFIVSANKSDNKKQLVYSNIFLDSSFPLFLNIGQSNPVALFCGYHHSAVIDENGSVIFITDSICDFPTVQLEAAKLPNNEKAVSVACCRDFVVVVDSNGNVFMCDINFEESKTSLKPEAHKSGRLRKEEKEIKSKLIKLSFKQVNSLKNIKIVAVSGFFYHCFAISEDNRIFGIGSNKDGRLCLGENIESVKIFTEISLLSKYKIKNVYAGLDHSLFQTVDGKILACGSNEFGQLMTNKNSEQNVYEPIDTGISGATFCLVGYRNSAIFIGYDPFMSPNRRVNDQKPAPSPSKEMKQKIEEAFSLKKSDEKYYIDNEEEKEIYIDAGKIGEGASSITYKVIDKRTNVPYCKKVLKFNNGEIEDAKRAMNEFHVMHELSHPCICKSIYINIIEPLEILNDEGKKETVTTIALFLEFVEYNLKKVLESKLISNTFKTKIVLEIVHAMNFLHKQGMMHRDLKIENIMINSVFDTKIVDFGYAKITETVCNNFSFVQNSLSKGIGTFDYMSPEMANEDDYDNKTDVYSFGIVLHFMFLGYLPKQKLREKLNGKEIHLPSPSDSISSFCLNLIRHCLSFSPEKRPSFEEILNYLRTNSYQLASNVDPSILTKRDKELSFIEDYINK